MKDFLKELISEINRIEKFYIDKLEEYNGEFENLKNKYKKKENHKPGISSVKNKIIKSIVDTDSPSITESNGEVG